MKIRIVARSRKYERGVTVLIVGLTLVAVIAMAALAIDVATLYQYHGEAQQAADAAALAGAKMFVTSGYTSVPGMDPATICVNATGPGNTAAVDQQAELAANANRIAGQSAVIKSIQCNITANRLNPQVTVSVTRTDVPTFFAKIFNIASNVVTATATAEAYNPSGQSRPITVSGVKPWLVPNCDPTTSTSPINPNCSSGTFSYFVDPATGSIGSGSFIGQTFCFSRVGRFGSSTGQYSTSPIPSSDPSANCDGFPVIRFNTMDIPIDYTKSSCPSAGSGCGQVGVNDYISNIACSSNYVFSCTQHITPSGVSVQVNPAGTYGTGTRDASRCLIHADSEGLDNGQDVFVPSGPGNPVRIDGGLNNPNASLQVSNISRSSSIVTVPLYDGSALCTSSGGGTCAGYDKLPQGFLQLGITQTRDLPNHFQAVILNVSGCNTGATGSPIAVQDGSPIAIRLIQVP